MDIAQLDQNRIESLKNVSKLWSNFFNKFSKWLEEPVAQWKPNNFIAYIDKRYREAYKENYLYSLKGTPSKISELYLVKRMLAVLCTPDMEFVKEYVDWVFDSVLIGKKRRVSGFGFFSNIDVAKQFIEYKAKQKRNVNRSTELNEKYKKIAHDMNLTFVKTLGDLAFIKSIVNKGKQTGELNLEATQYCMLLDRLSSEGFSLSTLDDIK